MERSFDFGALLQINERKEKKHKSRPTQFESVAGGIKKRLEISLKNRKSTRCSVFDRLRNLPTVESPVPEKKVPSKLEHRRMQLEKWKEEKEKKKKEALRNKKKPFVTGIAHNPIKYVPPPPPKPVPSSSGRVTRSQSSKAKTNVTKQANFKEAKEIGKQQSFAPKNASFNPPILKNMITLPKVASPKKNRKKHVEQISQNQDRIAKATKSNVINQETRTTRNRRNATVEINKNNTKKSSNSTKSLSSTSSTSVTSNSSKESPEIIKTNTPRKSLQKEKPFTPENKKIPKSESSSEEKLRSPNSDIVPMTPEQIIEGAKRISPCVTMSRGKDNARREMKKKIDAGELDYDTCEMESVDNFRMQLDSEIKRMTEMCNTWEKISEQVVLPDVVQEALLGAVGQARLLMSKKLQQFASLLRRCEHPEPGQPLVTPVDLQGFWDMVFMQIENVDMRFKKLEEMKSRGWAEEQPVVVARRASAKPAPASRKPAATSRLRDIIAAARKAKKEQAADIPEIEQPAEEKTFEAGFFSVRSPIKSPLGPATPSRPTLLKAVLSSEAKKSANKLQQGLSSRAMLRASLLGKRVDGDAEPAENFVPLTPINLNATPARSILKSAKKSGKKSIKVVLFDNSDTEIVPDETNDKNTQLNNTEITGIEKIQSDLNTDSGLSSMDIEKEEEKENKRRKSKLTRQDATDHSPVMTRSRRNVQTPVSVNLEGKKSSRRKKTLQEVEVNVKEVIDTPRRSSRRKSSVLA